VPFLALVGEVAAHVDVEAVQAGLEADDSARDDDSVLVRVNLYLQQITPLRLPLSCIKSVQEISCLLFSYSVYGIRRWGGGGGADIITTHGRRNTWNDSVNIKSGNLVTFSVKTFFSSENT
jgi:hypothetical protein